jgi:hypothetical protein
MAVLDIQRRGQQIGRIRIGQQVAVIKDGRDTGKTRPARLDTFRLTTASRSSAEAIAALFGGEIRDWSGEFEVITTKSEIGVTVPPRDEVISQWYEMWNKGGAMRRCDSQRDQISNGPCQCPHATDPSDAEDVAARALERADLAKLNPPRACKLVTRISVMIPDLPGLGVFRLDTGSYYAAVEIGDSAALMQLARDRGVFLPAVLRIEQRQRVAGGQTKKYPVPVLEVLATFRALATGAIEQAGIMAQLPPAPGEQRRALSAAPAARPEITAPVVQDSPPLNAQQIATAVAAADSREEVERWMAVAKENRIQDDHVRVPDLEAEVYEPLADFAGGKWKSLPAEAGAA